jgi:methionyl-tRNA formyltransferase
MLMSKIGFIGCMEISWYCLKKIAELAKKHGDELEIVFNLEEEKGLKYSSYIDFSSLQKDFNFNLIPVSKVSDPKNLEILKNAKLDVLFIIGWHQIVPQIVLDSSKIKLGIHSSLLPKDRGSSPINWQIIRGETQGGVTLFHLTAGVDAGNIVDQESYIISDTDNVGTVYEKATLSSLNLLEKNWNDIHSLNLNSIIQDENKITVNKQRRPSDGLIDWSKSSQDCYNWIRAQTYPYPGAFTFYKNKKIYIWKSKITNYNFTNPGQIIEIGEQVIVSTGNGSIELLSLQVEDEPICSPNLFSKSYNLEKNTYFNNILT